MFRCALFWLTLPRGSLFGLALLALLWLLALLSLLTLPILATQQVIELLLIFFGQLGSLVLFGLFLLLLVDRRWRTYESDSPKCQLG